MAQAKLDEDLLRAFRLFLIDITGKEYNGVRKQLKKEIANRRDREMSVMRLLFSSMSMDDLEAALLFMDEERRERARDSRRIAAQERRKGEPRVCSAVGERPDRQTFASQQNIAKAANINLRFPGGGVMNQHAPTSAERMIPMTTETNAAEKTATVTPQGAHVAPQKASSKKTATNKKAASKGKKKTAPAPPKKSAQARKKAVQPTRSSAAPRAESKGSKILDLVRRAQGASLTEIMKITKWQAHSVRGFISTAGKRYQVDIESVKNESGERVYRMAK